MTPIAVGFDLGGTLLEYDQLPHSWIGEYSTALVLVAKACMCEPTAARLQSGRELLLRYNAGVAPRPDEREYTADHIFQELLVAWKLPRASLASAINAFFGHFAAKIRAFPESVGIVGHLQQSGVPVGVLTDDPYGMPVELVRSEISQIGLKIPHEHVVTSTLVGHRKPHHAGFRTLAERLGVACHSLLYVGNERKDIAGGKGAGCRTALVWRDSCEPPVWDQDATIGSLDDLRKLLRS